MVTRLSRQYEYCFARPFRYHRALIDERLQDLYDRTLDVLFTFPHKKSFHTDADVDADTMMFVLAGVLNDHPILFWVEPTVSLTRRGNDTEVSFEANSLIGDKNRLMFKLRDACDSIRDRLGTRFRDDYSLSLALHDLLVREVVYEENGVMGHCALGPLLEGKGVCEGITEAYSLLMTSFGVRCTKIGGRFIGSETGHSWNISYIDGQPYHTDVTSDLSGYHRYFNCDDKMFSKTHVFKRFVACDSTEANYYHRNGVMYGSFDDVVRHVPFKTRFTDGFEFMVLEPADPDRVLRFFTGMRKGKMCTCTSSDDRRAFMIRYE